MSSSSPHLLIACATRQPANRIAGDTEFGKSSRRFQRSENWSVMVMFSNQQPLATLYNQAIDKVRDEDWLLFVHDDVSIDDFFLYQRLEEAFRHFDVVGIAGNTATTVNHVAWCYDVAPGTEVLVNTFATGSGSIYHSDRNVTSHYGPPGRPCHLIDGCFIAAKAGPLKKHGIRFDPQFAFHFYDVDFCRQCLTNGLRIGTWPIVTSHASGGAFGSAGWRATLVEYRKKWEGTQWPPAA